MKTRPMENIAWSDVIGVHRAIERSLKHETGRRRDGEGGWQRQKKWRAIALHQDDGDVSADHGEGAVRKVVKFINPSVTDSPLARTNSTIP